MAYRSFREVLAGLDTRLDTPPSIDSHHPDSGLALVKVQSDSIGLPDCSVEFRTTVIDDVVK